MRLGFPDVRDMQEGRTFQANVNKRRLHAGQDPHYLAQVNVAGQSARQGPLDMQFLHRTLQDQGNTGFLRGDVDQDILVHVTCCFIVEIGESSLPCASLECGRWQHAQADLLQ